MSLTFDTASRDTVAIKAFGTVYASCSANQKVLIDNTGTTTAGEGPNALTEIRQIAQWLTQAGIDTSAHAIADTLRPAMISLAVLRLVTSERPERAGEFRREYQERLATLADAFSKSEINVATNQGVTFTVQTIRYFVIDHCLRRQRVLRPAISTIDSAIQWMLSYLWARPWNFKTRSVTGSIATTSVITWTGMGSGNTFEKIATRKLYYTDIEGSWIQHINRDEIARLRSSPNIGTGRPESFHIQQETGGTTFIFYPPPDAVYAIRAMVTIAAPSIGTDATVATPFDAFPAAFKPIIRDGALARVLMNHNLDAGRTMWSDVCEHIDRIAPSYYDDRGEPPADQGVRDVYGDRGLQYDPSYGGLSSGGGW